MYITYKGEAKLIYIYNLYRRSRTYVYNFSTKKLIYRLYERKTYVT
jgi:hypothetical protein